MSRSPSRTLRKVTSVIDSELHKAAMAFIKEHKIKGGFSGYVSRLIVLNLATKGSRVKKASRLLPKTDCKK